MDDSTFLSIGIGLIVLVIVGGAGLLMSGSFVKMAEDRLEGLTGGRKGAKEALSAGILLRPSAINLGGGSFWAKIVPNAENLNLLYEQADVNLTFNSFMAVVGGWPPWAPCSRSCSSSRSTRCRWPRVSWRSCPSCGCSS